MKLAFSFAGFLLFAGALAFSQSAPIEAITFAGEPDDLYVPVRAAGAALGLTVGYEAQKDQVDLDGHAVNTSKHLYDGTKLVLLKDLEPLGAATDWDGDMSLAKVTLHGKEVVVRRGEKKITIDLGDQRLKAYQGDYLVFESRVSTGKEGKRTPAGDYSVESKSKMHYSKLYDNAPMPWSVQVNGNVFIHGYHSVPRHPASHGCIRMPINAAHWFYGWVENGTPVSITGEYADHKKP